MSLIPLQDRLSILKSIATKKFTIPYKSIPGLISVRALEEHFKIYQGYIDTLKRIDKVFENTSANGIPKKTEWENPFRALKQAETYSLNGIILHELYFTNLTPKPIDPKGLEIEKYIKKEFGSIKQFKNCIRGSIMEARGWAVLTIDKQGKCPIFMMDSHNEGLVYEHEPLIVIDSYEHSYFMDHGADKGVHADGTLEHLNWEEINNRFLKNDQRRIKD